MSFDKFLRLLPAALSLYLCASPIHAHEYWLDPIDSSVNVGSSAIVDIRNGQHFSGAAFPYDSSKYKSISITNADERTQYIGRMGDYPAIHPELQIEGLHSISVDTQPTQLTYDSWKKFNQFLDYHSLTEFAQRHLDRNLPTTAVTESYVRSAKTLVQVNDTGDLKISEKESTPVSELKALAPTNSVFEMIMLDDPYTDKSTLSAKLLFNGEPLAGRQVEMFYKGKISIRLTANTDKKGIASFKVLGAGDYLLNAVQLAEPSDDSVHWLSYWASITFER